MILKQYLKYQILSWCVDTFFNNIGKNMKLVNISTGVMPKVGETYSVIYEYEDDRKKEVLDKFYNCRITDVDEQDKRVYIEFEYGSCMHENQNGVEYISVDEMGFSK